MAIDFNSILVVIILSFILIQRSIERLRDCYDQWLYKIGIVIGSACFTFSVLLILFKST